jgi:tetratricopeptide (TPR) repeat protein
LNVTATKHDDEAIWYGDVVEVLLDTDSHSYYQIAVNPAGALVDLDRGANRASRFRWESQAEVATSKADDHWIVEIRIPVTDDENDPLNQVIGRKPSQSLPWHLNVCRQRARKSGTELSAISPTGKAGFHEPLKFAHFHDGGSHSFKIDETVTDFLINFNSAAKLQRSRKYAEAQAAFTALADYPKATDFQKSRTLAEAANCARRLRNYEEASKLASQIPLANIAKTKSMEILLDQKNWNDIVEQFGKEDLSQWPFTQIGAAAFARGRAHYGAKNGEQADVDYQLAFEFTSDPRTRTSILSAMARNRENVLKDEDRALETYRQIAASKTNTGGAEYFSGLQGAARLLTRRGEFDKALKILDQVDAEKLVSSWAPSIMLSRATTLQAAGKKDEALKTYRAVLANDSAQKGQKAAAQKGIDSIVQAK